MTLGHPLTLGSVSGLSLGQKGLSSFDSSPIAWHCSHALLSDAHVDILQFPSVFLDCSRPRVSVPLPFPMSAPSCPQEPLRCSALSPLPGCPWCWGDT